MEERFEGYLAKEKKILDVVDKIGYCISSQIMEVLDIPNNYLNFYLRGLEEKSKILFKLKNQQVSETQGAP